MVKTIILILLLTGNCINGDTTGNNRNLTVITESNYKEMSVGLYFKYNSGEFVIGTGYILSYKSHFYLVSAHHVLSQKSFFSGLGPYPGKSLSSIILYYKVSPGVLQEVQLDPRERQNRSTIADTSFGDIAVFDLGQEKRFPYFIIQDPQLVESDFSIGDSTFITGFDFRVTSSKSDFLNPSTFGAVINKIEDKWTYIDYPAVGGCSGAAVIQRCSKHKPSHYNLLGNFVGAGHSFERAGVVVSQKSLYKLLNKHF